MVAQVDITGGLFTLAGLDSAQVVLKKNGTYKQVQVARRGTQLFASIGGSYIALYRNGATSVPTWVWDTIEGVEHYVGTLGRLHMGKKVELDEVKPKAPKRRTSRAKKTSAA
jgi:hypothetical protein